MNDYYFIVQDGSARLYYGATTGLGKSSTTLGDKYALTVYAAGYETPDWMKLSITYQIFGDRFNNGDTTNDHVKQYGMGEIPLQFPNWINYSLFEDTRYSRVNPDAYEALKAENGWDLDWHNEVYGGDLAGVSAKLNYLQSVGVKTIYFNPLFESISAHKYDSADYSQMDPRFGSNDDFKTLAAEAKKRGMNIILDGVFNHVGSDSLYFNKFGKEYETGVLGAYEAWILAGKKAGNVAAIAKYDELLSGNSGGEFRDDAFYAPYLSGEKEITSPFSEWFVIKDDGTYEGWWGYDSLPVIQSKNGSELNVDSFADYIIRDDNSIARQWIENGSSGWRLDVSPEVSMDFWQQLRSSIKGADKGDIVWPNGEPIILAENWGDATNDFLSGAFDSTMNYRFRQAAIEFVIDEPTQSKYNDTGLTAEENWVPADAADVNTQLMTYFEKYPKESSYTLMNLLGSHDVPRILGVLGYVEVDHPIYPATINDIAADLNLDVTGKNIIYLEDFVKLGVIDQTTLENYINARNEKARERFMLASTLQMTYPGSPTIYYGDEVGMSGYHDPDNRREFNWSLATPQNDVLNFVSKVAKIRNDNLVLKTGEFVPILAEENSDVYVYGRYIIGESDALGNTSYIENYSTNKTISVAKNQGKALVILNKNSTTSRAISVPVGQIYAVNGDVFKDAISGKTYKVSNNVISITLEALTGAVLIKNGHEDDVKPGNGESANNGNTSNNGNPSNNGNAANGNASNGKSNGQESISDEKTPQGLSKFMDLSSFAWAKAAILKLELAGVIKGKSLGAYNPNDPITRSEFAIMLSRLMSLEKSTTLSPFKDVKSSEWYYQDLMAALKKGLFNDKTQVFNPQGKLTKEEAGTIVGRLLKGEGMNIKPSMTMSAFSDLKEISSWALEGMTLCVQEGLIVGNELGQLGPKEILTRAEAAVLLERMSEKVDTVLKK